MRISLLCRESRERADARTWQDWANDAESESDCAESASDEESESVAENESDEANESVAESESDVGTESDEESASDHEGSGCVLPYPAAT